ncbi:methylmalonyl Co-A mutase-associated GTPase MeaB [Planctomycetota bacterium]|nr:methylmalonyl Co-A mutase-associated GTPase MeaB [Planctomycetota bacterium]
MSSRTVEELVSGILRGHRRDLAQAITAVEQDELKADALLSALPPAPGAFRLGLTGAPGVGKSTFISKVVPLLIESGEKVAVLAVDPTSPVTGGALLGDRARMSSDMGDAGWFRSLASRGSTSGVAGCTDHAAEILARAGFGIIIIETVGVGQLEVEIATEADQSWLLLSPEGGDAIQLLKGGVLEVVQRVIVHKSDRPGADELMRWVEEAARDQGAADPVAVSSQTGIGLNEVVDLVLSAAKAQRSKPDEGRSKERLRRRLLRRAEQEWIKKGLEDSGGESQIDRLVDQVFEGQIEAREALAKLTER